MTDTKNAKPKRKRTYQQHGARALDVAVKRFADGEAWIDRLGDAGAAIREWRDSLVTDLGGEAEITTAQKAIVNLAVRDMLLLDWCDQWIISHDALINKRSRKLHPIAEQRMRYHDGLIKALCALGLDRKKPAGVDLNTYLEAKYGNREE